MRGQAEYIGSRCISVQTGRALKPALLRASRIALRAVASVPFDLANYVRLRKEWEYGDGWSPLQFGETMAAKARTRTRRR